MKNKFDLLKKNSIYINYKYLNNILYFDDIILRILELKNNGFNNFTKLTLLYKIQNTTNIHYRYSQKLIELLTSLKFLNFENNINGIISNNINNIKGLPYIINMIDNKIDCNQLLRINKIKKLQIKLKV